jgi:hypothetical protein
MGQARRRGRRGDGCWKRRRLLLLCRSWYVADVELEHVDGFLKLCDLDAVVLLGPLLALGHAPRQRVHRLLALLLLVVVERGVALLELLHKVKDLLA